MRNFILILSCLFTSWSFAAIQLSDSAEIYLLTCTQGEQVWSKYGHTGIRVTDSSQNIDIVFNYGVFDLMSDDFYIKFLRGETYYQLGIENYRRFISFYKSIGRTIYWQELNLNTEQKQKIVDALMVNYQPENRFYLYNFVFDNCATRPYHLIKTALQDSIKSDYVGYCGTDFRQAISHYTGRHSWVDFGINLIFGKDANQAMTNEERLFLPEELMHYISHATLSDGTPLVKNQEIATFTTSNVAWYATCWFGIAIFALFMSLLSVYDAKRKHISWWLDVLLFIIYFILIAIVVFMAFFSCHPLIGFNWRIILLPIIHICSRLVYFVLR